MTHDSFAVSKDVIKAFEDESGLTLTILQGGDAGEVVNKALLTAGKPQGDVLFGVDDNLLSRALAGELFSPYESDGLERVPEAFQPPDDRVTPIDRGDVCLNIDRSWFMKSGIAPPQTLADLTLPRYRNLLVVENAATSTPGSRLPARNRRPLRRRRLGGVLALAAGKRRAASSTAGRRRTPRSSPAPQAAPASGRSWCRTRPRRRPR